MLLFKNLEDAITRHSDRYAFHINNTSHTYKDLALKISAIRKRLQTAPRENNTNIGLVANDDLETYASIIAVWLEGRSYVPINPQSPPQRNEDMLAQAAVTSILDSSGTHSHSQYETIDTTRLPLSEIQLSPSPAAEEDGAYILFTSGTTGRPKGVPITRKNLAAFVHSFSLLGLDLDEHDKWLQMFDLTFDLSIISYLLPLLKGACVYTIPKDQIKYSYIFRLLDEQHLTVALMIPSIIQYLQPYFEEINGGSLKYSLFCGEALPLGITEQWSRCIPNAGILNVYGPSEATIFCTCYHFHPAGPNKTRNGILSIGRPMEGTHAIIIEHEDDPASQQPRLAAPGTLGELCLSGDQLTPGYLDDEKRNRVAFFRTDHQGNTERFYRTGDLACIDSQGDIMYIGRTDSQVKIQGFRVELSEIEFHARACLPDSNLAVITYRGRSNSLEIGLVIEGTPFDTSPLVKQLTARLPSYMIPAQIGFLQIFPYNSNGKIDRTVLSTKILPT